MKIQIHILPNINFTFIIKDVEMLDNREFHLIEHHTIIKGMLYCEQYSKNVHVRVYDNETQTSC